MKTSIKHIWILLVVLLGACVAQAVVVSTKYRKLEPRQNLIGTKAAKLSAVSRVDCSGMCLKDNQCKAYQYQGTGPGNCILIHVNCTDTGLQVMEGDIYSMVSTKGWLPPPGWTGPEAAFYQSFDGSNGLVLWEGTQQQNSVPLVPGQVNCAWTVDHTKKQWIDLGIHIEACMTRPETCGEAGGAVSVWMRVLACAPSGGIISSLAYRTSGLGLTCPHVIRVFVRLLDGDFFALLTRPTRWTHIVLNYLGPNNGQGIQIYYNGVEVRSDPTKSAGSRSAGDGRIVVGRYFTNREDWYSSVEFDELVFFNQVLSVDDIGTMYQSV